MQPQLRFNKDKRGYENTFLVQQAPGRRGRTRARILYWFRTPPGVRVGRGPLDEEAIRLLEAQNRDLQFDWTRILKGQPPPETRKTEPRPERERGREERGRDRKRQRPQPQADAAVPASPSVEAADEDVSAVPVVDEPTSAAHARLGSEGLGRLRARYSEMLARIGERIAEPDRQGELKLLAERLNPDAWVTDADVVAALESYESTFAALRAELVPPRPAESAPPDGE